MVTKENQRFLLVYKVMNDIVDDIFYYSNICCNSIVTMETTKIKFVSLIDEHLFFTIGTWEYQNNSILHTEAESISVERTTIYREACLEVN
jgi:hypothetical protein